MNSFKQLSNLDFGEYLQTDVVDLLDASPSSMGDKDNCKIRRTGESLLRSNKKEIDEMGVWRLFRSDRKNL